METPRKHPRSGWEESFRKMAERGDDQVIDHEIPPTEWEDTEWVWEKSIKANT